MSKPTRIERDTLGEIGVPRSAYYGAATARSMHYFAIGPDRMPLEIVYAIARIKGNIAQVHRELGLLDEERATWIIQAAAEIVAGQHDAEFPLSVYQTGSGTQTNMNVNEVIAGRSNELATGVRGGVSPVHPNDHVNMGQSSNDVFPSASYYAVVCALEEQLLLAIDGLRTTLGEKADAYRNVYKLGRTHLQDAVPMTFGDELAAHAATIEGNGAALRSAEEQLLALALGGTAVGTGINADPRVAPRVVEQLAIDSRHPFRLAADPFAALSGAEPELDLSAALRRTAATLIRLANDLRLLASGPRGGIGELHLPENEPGSSIMPGKVNPTQAEALIMAATTVYGLDTAIAMAAVSGHLQLNTARPLIAASLLRGIRLLADAVNSFTAHCLAGMEPDVERMRAHLDASLMSVTALVPEIGYDQAAAVARRAHDEGTSLRVAALALGVIDAGRFDELTDPARLAPRRRR